MVLKVQPVRDLLELEGLFERYAVSLEGEGWHKTPEQLFGQVKDGESVLALTEEDELIVFTWRAQAQIYRTTPDGVRERLVEKSRTVNGVVMKPKEKVSVSEKIWMLRGKSSETPVKAIIRCFLEELGIKGMRERDFVPKGRRISKLGSSSSFALRGRSCVFLFEHEMPYKRSKETYTEDREHKVTTWGWIAA